MGVGVQVGEQRQDIIAGEEFFIWTLNANSLGSACFHYLN